MTVHALIIEQINGLDIRNAAQYGDHAGPVRVRILGRPGITSEEVTPDRATDAQWVAGYARACTLSDERHCLVVTVNVQDGDTIPGTLHWYLYGMPLGFGMRALDEHGGYIAR